MRRDIFPAVLTVFFAAANVCAWGAEPTPRDQLLAMQRRVEQVIDQATPATVAVRVGYATGTGIIVSPTGDVLTAAHVSGQPDRNVEIIFPDGKRAMGQTLGSHISSDAGMIRITDAAPENGWPYVPIAAADTFEQGDWTVALGHPGGYTEDRPVVARLGRILLFNQYLVLSDCELIGGDSGGPLLDLQGHVIGIHSRIGENTSQNVHVPIAVFRESWDRLAAGERWGDWVEVERDANPDEACLGVSVRDHSRGVEVVRVLPGGPADLAGVKTNDIITALDGRPIEDHTWLATAITELKPGHEVRLILVRDRRPLTIDVTLKRRGDIEQKGASDE